jgi:hypothetical protein
MKYRDDMTEAETAELLAEVDALDECYADAERLDAEQRAIDDFLSGQDEADEQRAADWEASYEYFNRYIAGDR